MKATDIVLNELMSNPGLTDAELSDILKWTHQKANKACRDLEQQKRIRREKITNYYQNYPVDLQPVRICETSMQEKSAEIVQMAEQIAEEAISLNELQEDRIKEILDAWLQSDGWITNIAWGHQHGEDIYATRGDEKWIIEVKGCGSRQPMRVNYFLMVLGEILRHMKDENAQYSIALPAIKQYKTLWTKLPRIAKMRTRISALFVSEDGGIICEE